MKRLLAPLCLATATLLAVPAPAQGVDVSVRARIGDVRVGIDTGDRHGFRHGYRGPYHGVRRGDSRRHFRGARDDNRPLDFGGGPVNLFAMDQAIRDRDGRPVRRARGHSGRRGHLSGVWLPRGHYLNGGYYDGGRDDDDQFEDGYLEGYRHGFGDGFGENAPGREPAPAPRSEATPPDARGPQFTSARSPQAARATSYAVGTALPRGRPHVALDWEDYDLPRPPAGQTYVRFDGAVLLIETGSRVVQKVLWPTG